MLARSLQNEGFADREDFAAGEVAGYSIVGPLFHCQSSTPPSSSVAIYIAATRVPFRPVDHMGGGDTTILAQLVKFGGRDTQIPSGFDA
jgi:hypothetical protein